MGSIRNVSATLVATVPSFLWLLPLINNNLVQECTRAEVGALSKKIENAY